MMTNIKNVVSDEGGGFVLPNATVYAADANGNAVAIARSDLNGNINALVPDSSPNVLVTAPGYAPKLIDTGTLNDEGVTLTPLALSSPGTQVIKNTTASSIPWWVWVAGFGFVMVAASDDKKKRKTLSGSGSNYILPLALVGGAVFLLYQFGDSLSNIFTTGTSKNNDATNATIVQGTAATLQALADKGIQPTLTAAQAAGIANNIFNAGISTSTDNAQGVATIFNLLAQVRNDADIYLIMQNFGTRNVASSKWSLCYYLNLSCDAIDLDTFVTSILKNFNIPGLTLADLNNQLAYNAYGQPTGINYQF